MAKRFESEGSTGMRRRTRGPLRGGCVFAAPAPLSVLHRSAVSQTIREGKGAGRAAGARRRPPWPGHSHLPFRSQSPAQQLQGERAQRGGRLAQPSLKILDTNANPEGKERAKKASVHHAARAPHPPPQLYRLHSCRGGKTRGDPAAAENGSYTSASAGRGGGRRRRRGRGSRPRSRTKRASTWTP